VPHVSGGGVAVPVYIARFGLVGPCKIGCTFDVARRLENLGAKLWDDIYLLRLFDGGRADEARLHRRFIHQRIKHEWFHYHPDMMGDLGLPEITRQLGLVLSTLEPRLRIHAPERALVSDPLRAWMIRNDLREDELAPLVGCSRGTVSDWLRCGHQPQYKFQEKLRELSEGELFPNASPEAAA
jgi:hypothetical protein